MYVRLAFAVAAHLEPDILIVDEVLAVGDVAFQKKCLGKMEQVSDQHGRTVLFVSHNMNAINSLCKRALLLSEGKCVMDGTTSAAIANYYAADGYYSPAQAVFSLPGKPLVGDDVAILRFASIEDSSGNSRPEASIHDRLLIRMRYEVSKRTDARLVPNFRLMTPEGTCAFVRNAPGVDFVDPGTYDATCEIPSDFLNEGPYIVGIALTGYSTSHYTVHFFEPSALQVIIKDPLDERSNRYGYGGTVPGVLRPALKWSVGAVRK